MSDSSDELTYVVVQPGIVHLGGRKIMLRSAIEFLLTEHRITTDLSSGLVRIEDGGNLTLVAEAAICLVMTTTEPVGLSEKPVHIDKLVPMLGSELFYDLAIDGKQGD